MAKRPASKQQPAPKAAPRKKQKEHAEETTAGNIMWRLGLLLCVALVVISLLFASINGGSKMVGLPDEKPNTTPTPPVASVDPNQSVTGSDATPIPPSPIVPPTDAPPTDVAP